MAVRKYDYYQIAAEDSDTITMSNYSSALSCFSAYRKACVSVTIWGIDFQGGFHCIMSHK